MGLRLLRRGWTHWTDLLYCTLIEEPMRWKCICGYDGTDLYGWQSQVGGNTVQDFLEMRLAEIFKHPVRVHGSGRTDAGVHASAQVFHFDGIWKHPVWKLLRALQTGLPAAIQVTRINRAAQDFHARFSAKGKCYEYRIFEGFAPPDLRRYCWSLGHHKLDVTAMQRAADHLIGEHDFTAFSANCGNDGKDNPVKQLRELRVVRHGHRVRIVTEGSGYLYKMVRRITGALVNVGLNQLTPEEIEHILKQKKRAVQIQTAPASGLWLMKVFYLNP